MVERPLITPPRRSSTSADNPGISTSSALWFSTCAYTPSGTFSSTRARKSCVASLTSWLTVTFDGSDGAAGAPDDDEAFPFFPFALPPFPFAPPAPYGGVFEVATGAGAAFGSESRERLRVSHALTSHRVRRACFRLYVSRTRERDAGRVREKAEEVRPKHEQGSASSMSSAQLTSSQGSSGSFFLSLTKSKGRLQTLKGIDIIAQY